MSKEHKRKPPVFTPAEEPIPAPQEESHALVTAGENHEPTSGLSDFTTTPDPEGAQRNDEIVLKNGWKVISDTQHTGRNYLVTHDLDTHGVVAFWRRTRVLSHFKWQMHGKWSNSLTRADITPQPLYFKEA